MNEASLSTLQTLTGKYRDLKGNPCNENRDPEMRTGVPCNVNRVFPVRIDLQGVPCKPYRVWVCSVHNMYLIRFVSQILSPRKMKLFYRKSKQIHTLQIFQESK